MKRLGIFGGSFNPVHTGHCIMAEKFVEQMQLDRCLFIPTYISPFKVDDKPMVDVHHRLSMLRSICRSNSMFAIDEYEIRNAKISYTINTLRYLQERYPDTELNLLIGTDQAQSFQQWREWEEILKLARLCIARRPFINAEEEEQLMQTLHHGGRAPHQLDVPFIQISSRKIRDMASQNVSIRYLVPDKVRRYIHKNRLYLSNES